MGFKLRGAFVEAGLPEPELAVVCWSRVRRDCALLEWRFSMRFRSHNGPSRIGRSASWSASSVINKPPLELNAPVGGGPRWGGHEFAAGTVRTLLPLLERFGIASAEEVGVETLAERLREETVASGGVVKPPELVSAWATKP